MDYDPDGDYKLDAQGNELCSHEGCFNLAVNYSGHCEKHGGWTAPHGLTRWEALAMGYVRVEDLDDEELSQGVTRKTNMAIEPSMRRRIPRDIHARMLNELYKRHDEKLRGMLDEAIDVAYEIMSNDAYEASDRLKAMDWIYTRVRGKPTEKVDLTVDVPEWQKVLGGVLRQPQDASRAQRGMPPIDAEVVEDPSANGSPSDAAEAESVSDATEMPLTEAQRRAQAGETPLTEGPSRQVLEKIPGTPEYEARIKRAQDRAERLTRRKEREKAAKNARANARMQGYSEVPETLKKGK